MCCATVPSWLRGAVCAPARVEAQHRIGKTTLAMALRDRIVGGASVYGIYRVVDGRPLFRNSTPSVTQSSVATPAGAPVAAGEPGSLSTASSLPAKQYKYSNACIRWRSHRVA